MPTGSTRLDRWIGKSLDAEPPRSKSLIVTIFGDSLLPLVPGIWLTELSLLLDCFGMNAQLARTSSFRLADEGWLESRRVGRRSRYQLTEAGRQRIALASRRIYTLPPQAWDGRWTIVIVNRPQSTAAERTDLRQELQWQGFGTLAPSIFLHPRGSAANLHEVLGRLKLAQDAIVLHTAAASRFVETQVDSARPASALAAQCWNLDAVADHYRIFLKRFEAVPPMLADGLAPRNAFVLQTLLIHAYRRVVLHDPRLPATLLPALWPGHAAADLCRSIYRQTFRPAHAYLAVHLQGIAAAPIKPSQQFMKRFGGLG